MTRLRYITFVVLVAAFVTATPVAAQTRQPGGAASPRTPPRDRIFISVDGVFQTTATDFTNTVTLRRNVEDSSFSTSYDEKSGPAFNVSGAGLVWRTIAIGVGVSRFSHGVPGAFTASVPHPFFFNQARQVSGTINSTREELAVHVNARALLPLKSRRMQAMVFGGPSFFNVKQDLVSDFEITETYPYDTATFSRGVTTTASKSKVAFNAGADLAYFFTRQMGVGGTALYAGTTIPLDSAGGNTVDVKVGGFQVGGGLRLRF